MQRPVAPTQRDHSELMAAKINRAQQIERRAQAARRRLTLLTVQFAVGIVLVAAAAVTSFSWLWSLTPLATMGVTLFLGARAAQAGRENDQRALERIRALETRPAKGHRVSESEKKYAQLSAKAEDFGSQAKAETTAESESVKTSEQLEKTETITADTEAAATDQQTSGGLGQSALGKLAAAARRAANFREYFVRGEAEIAAKAHEETAETTSEVEVASQHQAEAPTETAAPAVAVSKETDAFESKPTEIAEVVAEIETEAAAEITADKADAEPVHSAATSEAESTAAEHSEHSWTPAPMPKPIYALKPRLARRDVDASELLAEHLAARGSAPYRPLRPRPHTEESLTTAQLVAQSKPVDLEAILDSRRIAN